MEYQWTFGTGTTLNGTDTNTQSLPNLSGISILVQGHARLSITTSRSLMRIVFKLLEGRIEGVRILRFWLKTCGVFFSYFSRVPRVE